MNDFKATLISCFKNVMIYQLGRGGLSKRGLTTKINLPEGGGGGLLERGA